MANNDLKGRVDLDVAGALGALRAAQKAFRDLEKSSTDAGQKMTQSQRQATKAIIDEYAKLRKAQSEVVNNAIVTDRKLRELERKGVNDRKNARTITGAKVEAINTGAADKSAEVASRVALNTQRTITEEKRRQLAIDEAASRTTSRALRDDLALRRQNAREAQAIARAEEQGYEHLNATRYALYDVSRMMLVAGAGAAAFEVASLGVAVAWERDFANVVRTTGVAGDEIKALKADFVELAQTIPETWQSLAQIGTLAGQLGIDPSQITKFTSVVAKFAATTDVSVEDAATAFGRLNSLLPDVNGNFEGIADAILKVGVKSVATESQIVRIATQISALGSQAGFSYDEIVGFAGALASVAVPPELSRGVTTRVFGQISRAIADGGANLERFGRIAGMSGAEFKAAWSKDSGDTFLRFMKGIYEQGGNAETAIRELGITSVRDVPILIRLANAANSAGEAGGLMAQTFRDAALSAGEMDRQYEIISNTVAAKVQVFQNTLQSLLDTIGSAQLGPLGVVLDTVTKHLADLQKFAGSDWGWILGVGAALTVVAGVLAILGGLAARGVASYAALITALQGLQVSASGAGISMGALNGMLAATGPLGQKAATGIRMIGAALKALAAVTVVLALPDVADWANKGMDALKGWSNDIDAVQKRLTSRGTIGVDSAPVIEEYKKMIDAGRQWIIGTDRMLANANIGSAAALEIKKYDDQLTQLVQSGNVDEVNKRLAELGITSEYVGYILPGTADAMRAASAAAGDGAPLYGQAAAEAEAMAQAEEEAAAATQALYDVFMGGDAAFVSLGGIIGTLQTRTQEWAEAQADATDSAEDSWQNFYDGQSINMQEYLAELQAQVDAQTNWETNMINLVGRVSDETLAELGRLGPEGAPLVAQLVTASDAELQKFDALFAQAGTDAGTEFAKSLVDKQTLINEVGANLGSGAKAELMAKLAAGEDFNKLLSEYKRRMNNLKMEVPAPSLAKPKEALDLFHKSYNGTKINYEVVVSGTAPPAPGMKPLFKSPFKGNFNGGLAGRGYDGGGYTGDGGKFDPAGIVHRGEFVFTKKATSAIGVSNLYGMMHAAQGRGYVGGGLTAGNSYVPSFGSGFSGSSGGGGSTFTELGAATIQAIAQALSKMPLSLYTTDRIIAESASRGSTELAYQGTK